MPGFSAPYKNVYVAVKSMILIAVPHGDLRGITPSKREWTLERITRTPRQEDCVISVCRDNAETRNCLSGDRQNQEKRQNHNKKRRFLHLTSSPFALEPIHITHGQESCQIGLCDRTLCENHKPLIFNEKIVW